MKAGGIAHPSLQPTTVLCYQTDQKHIIHSPAKPKNKIPKSPMDLIGVCCPRLLVKRNLFAAMIKNENPLQKKKQRTGLKSCG